MSLGYRRRVDAELRRIGAGVDAGGVASTAAREPGLPRELLIRKTGTSAVTRNL